MELEAVVRSVSIIGLPAQTVCAPSGAEGKDHMELGHMYRGPEPAARKPPVDVKSDLDDQPVG